MNTLMPLLLIALDGFVCYVLVTYVPMPHPFPQFLILAGIVIAIILFLKLIGVWDRLMSS